MLNKDKYPSQLLQEAVEAISSLPGVGQKSALRLALHLIRQPKEKVKHFTDAINNMSENISYCSNCMMLCDDVYCQICTDESRNRKQICVVESVRDVMSIERTGQYNGLYHVLGGIISPINGVSPSDLTIKHLVSRVETADYSDLEVIFALSADVEGETTAFYIYRQLSKFNIQISTLARGLSFGDDLEYADELSLGKSILNRQVFKPI